MDRNSAIEMGWKIRLVVALAALAVAAAIGQPVPAPLSSTGAAEVILEPAPRGEVYREIDDPHTGIHWLLLRENGHPGGPGRLVPVWRDSAPGRTAANPASQMRPVIRTGDRLQVEENSAVVEAHLEGIALGTAAVGGAVSVRLLLGGRILAAVALGPGRVVVGSEVRR